jgi:hypothetical protein
MAFLGRRSLILIPLLLAVAPTARATQYLYDKDGVKVFAGGFAELDVISDTTRSLGEVEGNAPVDKASDKAAGKYNANGDSGRLQFSDRNSRFAFGVMTARPNQVKTKGYVEFDLLGYQPTVNPYDSTKPPTQSEAGYYQSPTMRLRHAYLQAEGDGWSFLSGQYWSLFGWQPDAVISTADVSPISGTLYERTPQMAFIKSFGDAKGTQFQVGLAGSRPTVRDSAMPNADFGLRMLMNGHKGPYTAASGDLKGTPMMIGLSATARDIVSPMMDNTNTNDSGKISTTQMAHNKASATALDVIVPILAAKGEKEFGNTLTLQGEATKGAGYGDEFVSWTGNLGQPLAPDGKTGINDIDTGIAGAAKSDGKFTLIKLTTWNASLQYHLPGDGSTWTTFGAAKLMSTNAKDLNAGSKQVYTCSQDQFINFFNDFTPEMRAGLEYDWHQTIYVDNTKAQNNRIQLSTWYRF